MDKFVEVSKDDYTDFLKYLSENGGYTYRPVTISDCTLIYETDDVEQKNKIGARYFGGRPEIYEIREDKYLDFQAHKAKLVLSNIGEQTSYSGTAIGLGIKKFADGIRQEYGNQ